jgi:hypothetical protein
VYQILAFHGVINLSFTESFPSTSFLASHLQSF